MFVLSDLAPGDKGVIKEMFCNIDLKRRLLDLGMVYGTEIQCIMKSSMGDPKAYFIRGTLIALRNQDASKIILEG